MNFSDHYRSFKFLIIFTYAWKTRVLARKSFNASNLDKSPYISIALAYMIPTNWCRRSHLFWRYTISLKSFCNFFVFCYSYILPYRSPSAVTDPCYSKSSINFQNLRHSSSAALNTSSPINLGKTFINAFCIYTKVSLVTPYPLCLPPAFVSISTMAWGLSYNRTAVLSIRSSVCDCSYKSTP